MKKILAILLSIAMLCTVVPFGALVSADGENLIVNGDFETGNNTGWDASNDCIKAEAAKDGNYGFLASGGIYAGGSAFVDVEPNTTYIFSIDVKSPAGDNAMMYIKRLDEKRNEVTKQENPDIPANATEWTTFTKEIDSGDAVILQLQLCCGWGATDKYFDNASLVKKEISVDPSFDGVLYNGDFETGDLTKWEAHCADVFVTNEESYTGDYSVVLGCADAWAATLVQKNIKLEKNTDYVLSYYAIGVDGELTDDEADFKIEFRGTANDTPLKFADATLKDGLGCSLTDEWTKYEAVFNSGDNDNVYLKMFAFGTGNVLLVDDIKIEKKADEPEEPEEPEDKNMLADGGFESGNGDAWSVAAPSAITDNADYVKEGQYALILDHTAQWGCGAKQTGFAVEPNTDYVVSFWNKRISGDGAWNLYIKSGNTNMKLTSGQQWFNQTHTDWVHQVLEFNSGDYEVIDLYFQKEDKPASFAVDEVVFMKKSDMPTPEEPDEPDEPDEPAEPSTDGYITNGDFETGDKTGGWEGGTVSKDAAKDGNYGVAVTAGTGEWNEYAALAVKNIAVEPNTDYVLTFDHKIASGAMMFGYIKDCSSGSPVDAGQKDFYPEAPAGEWTAYEYKFNSGEWTAIYIQLCVGVKGETRYFDNIKLVKVEPEEPDVPDEPEEPVETPIVANGDFEAGVEGWTLLAYNVAEINGDAAKEGALGLYLNGGWSGASQTIAVEANTDYEISFWVKGYAVVYVKPGFEKWPDTYADWTYVTYEFNSGDNTELTLELNCGSNSACIDNVVIEKKATEPEIPEEPGETPIVANGDFEAGVEGWTLLAYNVAEINGDAAKEGALGLYLNGGWSGASQTVAVEANTDYEISFWVKGYAIVYLKPGFEKWPDTYADWTYVTYEFNSGDNTELTLELNCGSNSACIDNVVIEKKASEPDEPDEPDVPDEPDEPEDKNMLADGGFESGNGDAWSVEAPSAITDNADYVKEGQYALILDHTAQWGCGAKQTGFAVEPNTDYVVSFWNKRISGDGAWNLYIKSGSTNMTLTSGQQWFNQTHTDWVHQVLEFNSGNYEVIDLFFQKEDKPASFAVDEVVFMKKSDMPTPDEPEVTFDGYLYNGDFETGDLTKWEHCCDDVFVTNEESYTGDYSAVLGCAHEWAATLVQKGIAVEKNTEYVLSFYAIGVDGELTDAEADFKIEFRTTTGDTVIKNAEGKDGVGFSLTDEWTKYEFKFNSGSADNVWMKLFSFGTGNVLLIDDITIAEYVPEPSFDGYITNGDFELGDLTGDWFGNIEISKDAAKDGEFGIKATAGTGQWDNYQGLENKSISVTPNTEYVLSFDHLTPSGAQAAVYIKGVEGTSIKDQLADFYPECEANTWMTSTVRFNSGKYDKIYIQLCVFEHGGIRYFDNVTLAEYVPEPGEKENPYQVSNPMMAPGFITIPANSAVYYQFSMSFFDGYTIAASGVTAIEVDGVKYTDVNEFDEVVAKLKATSLQSGLVGFFNETDEETSAMISYSEPYGTMFNPLPLVEGVNKVDTVGAYEYFAAYAPDFNGNLTIKATVGEDFTVIIDNNGEIIEPEVKDGKIVLTIEVESYTTVMLIINTTGAATELDIDLAGPAIGSETRPIWVDDPANIAEIDLSNGTVYYTFDLMTFDGTKLFVTGDENAYVTVNGTRYDYDAEAGAVVAILEDNDTWQLKVEIGTTAEAPAKVAGEVEFPVGTKYNPQVLVDGDAAIKFPAGDRWYAAYTALADGTLTLTPAAAQFADIQLNIEGTETWAYLFVDELQASVSIEVKAGDVVIIAFYGGYDEDGNAIDVDTTVKVEGPAAPLNGWVLEDGKWAFYVDDVKVTDKWMKDSKGWCYLGSDGYWVTNAWVRDSVTWCYIGADGYCVTDKWVKDSTGWCYLGADGRMVTNAWVRDSVGWCYVGSDGYCVTNKWVKDSTGWCYIGAEGRMLTNAWVRDSKGWCYLDANGYCLVDTTATIDGVKYTFDKNGNMI